MEENDNEFDFECAICGKFIPMGKPYVSISKSIEHIEHNIISNCDEVEIIESNILVTLCGSCGNIFDDATFIQLIKTLPLSGNEDTN